MPDQYGNPTFDELLLGYAPNQQVQGGSSNYTDYSGYNPSGPQDMGYGNATPATGSGYSPEVQAAVDARNNSGMSTRDVYGHGGLISHDERATPERNNAAGATNFQSAFADDPYYQRQDIAPFISATNEDVRGGGKYGIRGWMNEHPLGVMGAFAALAAGGAALSGGLGGGAGATAQHALPAGYGSGSAAGGLQQSSGLGIFANGGAGGMAGVGAGNAGRLAASGLLGGGAAAGAGTGLLGSLANSSLFNTVLQNVGSLGGGQQQAPASIPQMSAGGSGGASPHGMLGSQPITKPVLPGVAQPKEGYSRRPYQFHGTTVWM